ncbi:class I SAM-dependent methyltransferase [Rhodoflexus sp.]
MEQLLQTLPTTLPSYERESDLKRLNYILWQAARFVPKDGHILDVGCGNGIVSINLGAKGYNVLGIDVSDKTIATAEAQNPFPNVSFRVLSAEQLRDENIRYDLIVCSEVIEHLHQPEKLLTVLHDILNPQGRLVVTVPNGKGPREVLVTQPMLKLRSSNGFLWKTVQQLKKGMGYQGYTIQSDADNLDHVQFFSKQDLQRLAHSTGFTVEDFGVANFIADVFPLSFIANRVRVLQKIDCNIADRLPDVCSSGFFTVWKRQ